jgi:uncharacterized protein YecE (DUF72 family)
LNILVGTASWTDPTLLKSGKFYPRGMNSADARLRYYAERYPIVEVDSSYYALPSYRNAELWVERTPASFVFNIKAFRFFTHHQTQLKVLPPNVQAALADWSGNLYYEDAPNEVKDELWRQFVLSLEPLVNAGKLGTLLFQFPKWFIVRRSHLEHLREIRARLPEHPIAIEFRHESWFSEKYRERTLAFEREMNFTNVTVDEPQLQGSIPTVWEPTNADLGMFRLHGRNAATWNKKGLQSASDRFNYDYTEQELAGFVPPVFALARQVKQVHVILNNNLEDQGVRNARTFMDLLGRSAAEQR